LTQQTAQTPAQPQTAQPSSAQALAGLLDQVSSLAAGYDRGDLVDHLAVAKQRVLEPTVRVLVVGEYKKGKSSLVNGILAVPVAPVDDDIATSVPTIVRYGQTPRALLTREPENGDGSPSTEEVSVNDLPSYVCESGNPGNAKRVRHVEVWLPRQILQMGLVLVDTPGVGGLGSVHTAATLATLPTADAVIFVTDASQELTSAEIEFLRVAERSCPNILCVLTKIDLYPEYKRIFALDEGHLRAAGMTCKFIALSSVLRQVALRSENKEVNAESGYPELVAYLRDEVLGRAADLARRSVLHDSLRAVDEMQQPFAAEREALTDPEKAQAMARELQEAKERAERLRGKSARWQLTLNDGFGDLNSEVDHDLRRRMREVTRVAEEAIDQSDPAHSWEEFKTWLNQRVTYEVVENYSLIADQAHTLAEQVAEHFEEEEQGTGLTIEVEAPAEIITSLGTPELEAPAVKPQSAGMMAIRQAYSNIGMFNMLGNITHLALGMSNPVTLVLGLISGGVAFHGAKEREMAGRRQQAKMTVRKYLDEVNFYVGKDFRDTIRYLQRHLRDNFAARAEEVQRSTAAALSAVQQAAQQDQSKRQQRVQAIDAELQRLATVKQRLTAMTPQTAR
jgi:hypothetical protein